MRISLLRSAAVACMMFISMLPHTEQAQVVKNGSASALAQRIATEASTELSLASDAQVVLPSQVRLEEVTRIGTDLVFFRAWVPRDHWHAYQAAVADSRIITLGGFQNPDLVSIAEVLARVHGDSSSVRGLAEKLAILADNSGGVQYRFPDRAASALRSAWHRAAPTSWPNDTLFDLVGGAHRVRLTLLSQETHSYTQHWIPTLYAFTFAADGHLQAWSRRSGTPVAAEMLTAGSLPKSLRKSRKVGH